jgi:hypothetical protein
MVCFAPFCPPPKDRRMTPKLPNSDGSGSHAASRWDEGPCYICGGSVPPSEGWHREDFDGTRRHWCKAHRPVWSYGDRYCVQHGFDYSAICAICGKWWRETASPEERRTLKLLAAPLVQQDRDV